VICRVCQAAGLSGENAQVPKGCVFPGLYVIAFNCHCGATLGICMWMSEDEALQRHAEEQRREQHAAANAALAEARRSGAAYAVLRRLEQREEQLAFAE
jgi:hypothetical protein